MIDDELRFSLWKYYKGRCVRCKCVGVDFHHIIPKSNGGEDVFGNLVLLCADCHDWAHRVGTKSSKEELLHYAYR